MLTPHRDETESLRRRLVVLGEENAELKARRRARAEARRPSKDLIHVLMFLCIIAPFAGSFAGCAAESQYPVNWCAH